MPFTKFTNLDFDQIKTSIKDYLRANSTFTDFDFEGSNFSVLIDTLAYNTYITAFNSNMTVNESFLDSATLRENVVSLARNIGYVPRSRACAKAEVSFSVTIADQLTSTLDLEAGLVCVGSANDSNFIFSIPERVVTTVDSNRTATFNNIDIYQGTFLEKSFLVDGSLDQRFILDNSYIDSSTIVVRIRDSVNDVSEGREYQVADNILKVDSTTEMYLLQEVQDEKYELLFGDGFFGKKLATGNVIDVSYIITDGKDGNGAANFAFSGRFRDDQGKLEVPTNAITITTNQNAMNLSLIHI